MDCLCANADGKAHTIRTDKETDCLLHLSGGLRYNNHKLLERVKNEGHQNLLSGTEHIPLTMNTIPIGNNPVKVSR